MGMVYHYLVLVSLFTTKVLFHYHQGTLKLINSHHKTSINIKYQSITSCSSSKIMHFLCAMKGE